MRIVYLVEWDAYSNSGVLTKISSQLSEWEKQGHECLLVMISPYSKEKEVIKKANVQVVSSEMARKWPFYGKHFLNRIFCSKKAKSLIDDFNPELIYYRQGIWYPGLSGMLEGYCVVMELNTLDINESSHYNFLFKNVYLFGRNRILKNVNGMVAVSNEIAATYDTTKKPIVIISNGYTLKDMGRSVNDSDRVELIMVGTPNQSWHGVDKLSIIAEHFTDWKIHLVGPMELSLPDNVVQHGILDKGALSRLYMNVNIGLGSLALHRKDMNEASPLKTREYANYGLPMIIGYQDTDLEGQPFVLNIGNYENNVKDHLTEIATFVNQWKAKVVRTADLEPLVGIAAKEKSRLDFFQHINQA